MAQRYPDAGVDAYPRPVTSEAWERAARVYTRQEPLEKRAIGRALDLAVASGREELLDVATGTGLVLRELAQRPTRPAQAVGLDQSAAMLERIGPLPAGWRTQRGDATALPFADADFDVATAAYLLHVLEPAPRAAALRELRRVVRPGGRLVVVTVWTARSAARALLAGLSGAAPATLGGLRPFDPRNALAEAGWTVEHAAALHHGYPSLVVRATRAMRGCSTPARVAPERGAIPR